MSILVRRVDQRNADTVHAVIRRAFGARRPLDPPAGALAETPETVALALADRGGLLATSDDQPVGCLIFGPADQPALMLTRFGVVPEAQGTGVAGALVREAAVQATAGGHRGLHVVARVELPSSLAFWEHHGFARTGRHGVEVHLLRLFEHERTLATAEEAEAFGQRLAGLVRAGDVVILTGELGAGKTTLTRGLGAGLDVRGGVTSPTFVIAREHPSNHGGPALVHVDAYRLGGIEELDDLDLDTSLDAAVTVVEWGEGIAEGLADERLELRIVRAVGADAGDPGDDTDPRTVTIRPVGLRWLDAPLVRL